MMNVAFQIRDDMYRVFLMLLGSRGVPRLASGTPLLLEMLGLMAFASERPRF